jgi:hypothetical protein
MLRYVFALTEPTPGFGPAGTVRGCLKNPPEHNPEREGRHARDFYFFRP